MTELAEVCDADDLGFSKGEGVSEQNDFYLIRIRLFFINMMLQGLLSQKISVRKNFGKKLKPNFNFSN